MNLKTDRVHKGMNIVLIESEMISEYFGNSTIDNKRYFLEVKRAVPIMFLDSGTGDLGEKQWNWFERMINSVAAEDLYIFMHHPPLLIGVPYMDNKHSFTETDHFQEILAKYPEKRFHFFCGHYHVDRTYLFKNTAVPSAMII